jgi:putative ABC transport system substrate-binding protein
MKRRAFVAGMAAAVTVPRLAQAQQSGKVYRVGAILTTTPIAEMEGPDPIHLPFRAFVHTLRKMGYIEGRNLILDRRSAEGAFERIADIAAELISYEPDALMAVSSVVVQRARRVTSTVPIVQVTGYDPVAMGLAQSVAGSGTNVTGLTTTPAPDVEAKRLQLLTELVPKATRIAFLGMKSDWDSSWGRRVRDAARALRVTIFYAEHQPNTYEHAFAVIERERANAVYLAANAPNWQHRRLIAGFAQRNGLPTTSALRDYAEVGGLMSYGFDVLDNFRRAAGYIDKILKGVSPGELPIEQPRKFAFVINLKTAKALGLTIPQSLLARADEVIE